MNQRCCRAITAGVLLFTAFPSNANAADLVKAADGSGVYGYKDTPALPWTRYLVHDPDRPDPKRVQVPAIERSTAPAPSDALVLFDGKDLHAWEPSKWRVVDGEIEAGAGGLSTRESFGDCQIHLEWLAPANFQGPWYNQGNNGVLLMGLFEIQIFDSWNEKIYPDGMAAAIYAQTPPLVNACRPPGEWQSFDIFFRAPVFSGDKLVTPARLTMLHNGVLVHLDAEIHGETGHRIVAEYKRKTSKGPLVLSGHDCPVRFRNIWIRPL
jgi:hypothetical protein